MKTLFSILFACIACSAFAVDTQITATVTLTNGTVNGETITVNSDARIWTNSVSIPASQILTNSTANGSAGTLFAHVAAHAFSGITLGATTSTNITLKAGTNVALTVTVSSGYAVVTYGTNAVSVGTPVIVPLEIYPLAARTNVSSGLTAALNDSSNTNNLIAKSTNVTLSAIASLTAASAQTNYTLPLLPGVDQNLVQIYTINTNVFFTLTGTNQANWRRSVLLRAKTNTLDATVTFASPVVVNGTQSPVTAGKDKLLWIYNPDTTGTNVIVFVTDLPSTTGSAGTFRSATFNAQGIQTAGSNPTTFAGYAISDTAAHLFSALTTWDGASWTNLTYQYVTNNSGSTTLSWSTAYRTNLAANVTIALAPVTSAANSPFYQSIVYWVTNSSASDFKVTSPSGVIGPVGSGTPAALYCTNHTITRLLFEHYGPSDITVSKTDFGN